MSYNLFINISKECDDFKLIKFCTFCSIYSLTADKNGALLRSSNVFLINFLFADIFSLSCHISIITPYIVNETELSGYVIGSRMCRFIDNWKKAIAKEDLLSSLYLSDWIGIEKINVEISTKYYYFVVINEENISWKLNSPHNTFTWTILWSLTH